MFSACALQIKIPILEGHREFPITTDRLPIKSQLHAGEMSCKMRISLPPKKI